MHGRIKEKRKWRDAICVLYPDNSPVKLQFQNLLRMEQNSCNEVDEYSLCYQVLN